MFSSVIRLGDLDYIAPSQACIKPVLDQKKATAAQRAKFLTGDDPNSSGGTVFIPGKGDDLPPPPPKPIKITLADCLACSGCVTTAEEVLIEQQQPSEVTAAVKRILSEGHSSDNTVLVASVSPQSLASLAVQFHDPSPAVTFQRLRHFFLTVVGMQHVVTTDWAASISRREVVAEFAARKQKVSGAGPLPMIVSACPGFVCYVEKSHPNMIPYLSTAMSPQAVLGVALTRTFAIYGKKTYHVSVQPCFDRKLEASRAEFSEHTHCVLSTLEIVEWVRKMELDWSSLPGTDEGLPPMLELINDMVEGKGCAMIPSSVPHQGSGGYHQAVLLDNYIGAEGSPGEIVYTAKRNSNHCDVKLDGSDVKAAIMYGFQHIQNLSRTMKKQSTLLTVPHLVEVMACPGGCTNGGAQGRPRNGEDNATLLRLVNSAFEKWASDSPTDPNRREEGGRSSRKEGPPQVRMSALYEGHGAYSVYSRELFHTFFTDRQEQMKSDETPEAARLHALKW